MQHFCSGRMWGFMGFRYSLSRHPHWLSMALSQAILSLHPTLALSLPKLPMPLLLLPLLLEPLAKSTQSRLPQSLPWHRIPLLLLTWTLQPQRPWHRVGQPEPVQARTKHRGVEPLTGGACVPAMCAKTQTRWSIVLCLQRTGWTAKMVCCVCLCASDACFHTDSR
jgi:hypothetical protein